MKKLIFLLIIAALAFYLWYSPHKTAGKKIPDSTGTTVGAGFHPDPSNATFTFDGDEVRLSGGTSSVEDEAGFVTQTETLDQKASGDLNNDGKEDTVVLLAQSAGASGTFIYAAAYVSGPVSYKGTNAVFLGDRIAPQSVSISGGIATVKYLDRKPDEPFSADPTVSTSKQFIFVNGELQEK